MIAAASRLGLMPGPQPDVDTPGDLVTASERQSDLRRDVVPLLSAVIVVALVVGLFAWRSASQARDDAVLLRARGGVVSDVAGRFDAYERSVALFLLSGRPEVDPGAVPAGPLATQVSDVARMVDGDEAALERGGAGGSYRGADLSAGFSGWSTEAGRAAARVRAGETLTAEEARLPGTDPLLGVDTALGSFEDRYERAARGRDDAATSAVRVLAAMFVVVAAAGLHLVVLAVRRGRRTP